MQWKYPQKFVQMKYQKKSNPKNLVSVGIKLVKVCKNNYLQNSFTTVIRQNKNVLPLSFKKKCLLSSLDVIVVPILSIAPITRLKFGWCATIAHLKY